MRTLIRNFIIRVLNAAAASAVAFVALPKIALAVSTVNEGLTFVSSTGLSTTDVRTMVARIIGYFFMLLGIIAVSLIMYAGYLWMTAGGNEEKVATAKRIITQAVIGLAIIMSAYAITQFIVRALSGEDGSGTNISSNGCPAGQASCCPPGQICAINLGGGAGFRVSGITPAGAGPNNGGWPKNYAITVDFSSTVAEASVTTSTVEVTKCNVRVDGGGAAQAFRGSACSSSVVGTLTVDGSRVTFRPSGTEGENSTDFEPDFWYRIRLLGGGVRSSEGSPLACPFQTADISSPEAGASYCERATAFNNQRDTQPPTVTLNAPASPPAYCPSPSSTLAQIVAVGNDDFLVAGIDFLLDGSTNGLVNDRGLASATAVNGTMLSPFEATSVSVKLNGLATGTHVIRAIARDGVPQNSTPAERSFVVVPGSCCNGTRDEGETGNDCGGICGSCNGDTCTTGSQCASGVCTAGKCAAVPNIKSLSTYAAGPGSMVTITGSGFGTTPGSVTFLGADTDGNGDAEGDADDVVAQACAPQAWEDTRVVVAVPTGAVGGPIKLTGSIGSDRTDDTVVQPVLPNFRVTNEVVPGICYLNPSSGAAGTKVEINGAGFGQSVDTGSGISTVTLGEYNATVATCEGGATACGWSDSKIYVVAPPAPESEYQMQVNVAEEVSNPSNYLLSAPAGAAVPRVTGVIPEDAPVGSYVTIVGSGFGNRKGVVRFTNGTEIALAADPICDDSWHDNAIVVKVPPRYQGGLDVLTSDAGVAHGIIVETPSPSKVSYGDISLLINNDPPRPGVCSISPDNGPAGTVVEIRGEGFGTRSVSMVGAESSPRYAVNFYQNVAASLYSSWEDTLIGTVVAGQIDDAATWPKTGPVHVVANNQASANTVNFTVGDCRSAGASCGAGTQCCQNTGICSTSCEPAARTSAYGWQFSTSVLPSLPQVVERALCSASPAQMQSPSPSNNSKDACVNAQMFVEFTRPLDRTSFTNATVIVEECGSGDTANCANAVRVPLAPFGASNFAGCESLNSSLCRMMQTTPATSYNNGLFVPSTWYRVTLVSNPAQSVGLREGGGDGKYLDGDRDKRQGGNYVYTFRARDNAEACEIASVQVLPSRQLIEQDETPAGFNAGLLAGNCNLLQCGANQPYVINWVMNPTYLQGTSTANANCTVYARGVAETPTGVPTRLTAVVAPSLSSRTTPVEGGSDVTIKFAEPRVVAVAPKSECGEACINARVGATFNVPMDADTLNAGNIQLLRCRNASCSAPFMPDLGGGVTYTVTQQPVEPPTNASNEPTYRNVTVQLSGNLQPATFYMVRIRGGVNGVKSRSGVALTGLNDGAFYSWKFRTTDSAVACQVARTTLEPASATLRFVGDRAGITARAFGAAGNACADGGQELDAAAYNWLWSFEQPNRVLQGFVNGAASFFPPERRATPSSVVDTRPAPAVGCTTSCTLTGSQNVIPQCGNGVVDSKFETCDDGNANDTDSCRNNCTLTGTTAALCGNGVINPGEQCEKIDGVFPPGCKEPGVSVDGFATNIGCIFTGSQTAANSTCGDGFVSDGESCDDGNNANGDGCSSSCLHEGTLRSCLGAPVGEQCINFCGNGRVEPGEDPVCESNPTQNGCNARTCLKRGTPSCTSGVNCCGNGITETGEDAGCDASGGVAEFCTANCTIKGSSAFYSRPSFCGDGIVGYGEAASCESTGGNQMTDAYQAVVANVQPGFDNGAGANNTSSVRATVSGVPQDSVGRANFNLSCTCKTEPAGTQDAFCANLNPSSGGGSAPFTDNMACADSGCCMPRPTVVSASPTSFNACRNAQVRVVFSELMKEDTVRNNLLVGFANGTAACPTGTTEVGPTFAFEDQPSLLKRLWNGIAGFIRNTVLRPVFGAAAPVNYDQQRYCTVQGTVEVHTDGTGAGAVTVATFSPLRSFPADKIIRTRLNGGVMSATGTPLSSTETGANAGYRTYFATGTDICAVSKVEVIPNTLLLSDLNEQQTVTATAISSSGDMIVPTVDYGWVWSWDALPLNSPLVLTPRIATGLTCGLGSTCTESGGCPCVQAGQTLCSVPNGQNSCASTQPQYTGLADVRVRGSRANEDAGYVAKNSKGQIPLNAFAVLSNACALNTTCDADGGCTCSQSGASCTVAKGASTCALPTNLGVGSNSAISSRVSTGTASATVMLCRNPWPAYKTCTGSGCTTDYWAPFRETFTNVEFYYCRDQGTSATDTALPCLKETPATVLTPTADILREYLFTYETNVANCPNGPQRTGAWQSDAVGMRVASNPTHRSISDWYEDRGFRGNPTPTTVDGYEALSEGRTVYVNAGSKTAGTAGTNQLYTNAYVLSSSEGSQPETTAIFNRIMEVINFNANPELLDAGVCRVGTSREGQQVMCTTDADCRTDAAGRPVAGRESYTCNAAKTYCMDGNRIAWEAGKPVACSADVDCFMDSEGKAIRSGVSCDVPKSKLTRDVKRWSDLMATRDALLARRDATGAGFPTLEAGTFLRSQSFSAWPSWIDTLAKGSGLTLPLDPVNRFGVCDTQGRDYDPDTCWDDAARAFMCPTGSHVYDYRSLGGTDFALRNDFEFSGPGMSWAGSTCVERNDPSTGAALASCATDPSCIVDGSGRCNFRTGQIYIGGSVGSMAALNCSAGEQTTATGGSCGDGIKQANEVCEIGQTRAASCDADPGNGTRAGALTEVCNNSCNGWAVQGRCSLTSANANALCVNDGDCGANGMCLNTSAFRCVGPAGNARNGTACTSNASCNGGICASACVGGSCGDGKVQAPEKCDDGALNGTYGHCNATCSGVGLACGDGQRQPNEACDCGALNGQYSFNGILPVNPGAACGVGSTNVNSCSWDCSAAGPRCGDGIVNGSNEQCDGGFEEFRGFCNDNAQTGCDTSAQCPSIGTCGSNGRCTNGSNTRCSTDADCVASCGNFCSKPEERRRRACGTNDPSRTTDDNAAACKWSAWTCTGAGSCGNGRTETGEQCDDGNTDNTDACVIDPTSAGGKFMCTNATCGDGFIYAAGGEECDDGSLNNRRCTPEYGQTCNFCSSSCRVVTVSGAFCGDNVVQGPSSVPPGPEACEGQSGLSGGLVCVSNRPEHQSFGYITGTAGCSQSSCQFACADPNSTACSIGGGDASLATVNADNFSGPNGSADTCDNRGLSASALAYCKQLTTSNNWVPAARVLSPIGIIFRDLVNGNQPHNVFRNVCDPDDDNDGVPDVLDCGSLDPTIHPRHTIVKSDGNIVIPAAGEDKADLVDNNCNGIPESSAWIEGSVVNVQTGGKLDGASFRLYCEGTYIGGMDASGNGILENGAADTSGQGIGGRYNDDGYFSLYVPFDMRKCNRTSGTVSLRMQVDPPGNQQVCRGGAVLPVVDTTLTFTVGGNHPWFTDNQSVPTKVGGGVHIEVSPKPTANHVVASLTWANSEAMDFQMYASNGRKINLTTTSVNDGGYAYKRTDFSRASGTSQVHTQSISVHRKPGVHYNFWVSAPQVETEASMICTGTAMVNGVPTVVDVPCTQGLISEGYDNSPNFDWRNLNGFGAGGKVGPKLRIYYDNCAEYKPETYARWPAFLDRGDLRWMAFLLVPDVDLPASGGGGCGNKYSYCCIDGTTNGPCAALCSSNGTNGDGMRCVGAYD